MSKKIFFGIISFCFLSSPPVYATDGFKLNNDKDQFSYALGTVIGDQLRQQFESNPEVDFEVVLKGVLSASAKVEPLLAVKQVEKIMRKKQEEQLALLGKKAKEKQGIEQAFLKKNKNEDGVITTRSGLQYRIIESGDSSQEKATLTDTVVVNYEGTLVDGSVFDSSYQRGEPVTFGLGGVIPGWQEVLQLMVPGDKWQVVIPSKLAYGGQGVGRGIGPYEPLVFDIELIRVNKRSG